MHSSGHHESMRYRPDIDGLRAVAVLSVFAYHAGYVAFSGGFVGVDIFFVISGYLITGLLTRDINQGCFSLLSFYERRIRRILPAMFVMFFVVSLFAWRLLLPADLIAFEKSLLAALLSGSNFFFWHQTSYFESQRFSTPLLHTWSLAVEEQFYLLLPPLLLVLHKGSPRRTKVTIIAIAVLSFAAATLIGAKDVSTVFYLAPFRTWELLLGAILSQGYLPRIRSIAARQITSIAGLCLILATVFFYRETAFFPALATLPPCIGTFLVIAAGETGPSHVGRILSWKPLVFVGLISYSLYLWHWPVLAFQATNWLIVPYAYSENHLFGPANLLVSMALAVLSWAFVERPFRSRKICKTRRSIFLATATAIAAFSIAAFSIIHLHGIPMRFTPDVLQVASYNSEEVRAPWRSNICFISPQNSFADYRAETCLAQHTGRKSLLLLGDSYAAALYPGLVKVFPDYDIMQATYAGCSALLQEPSSQPRDCQRLFSFIFDDFLTHHHIDMLVFAGRWLPADYNGLGKTLRWSQRQGIPVVLVGRNLEFDAALPALLARNLRNGLPDNLVLPPSAIGQASRDHDLAELARNEWHVPYVSFFESFCHPDCPVYAAPRVPMTFDRQHFTLEGSALYATAVRARIGLSDHAQQNNLDSGLNDTSVAKIMRR
jgi:peptidoglycan/LPS O-acetylase OafA/YrhL